MSTNDATAGCALTGLQQLRCELAGHAPAMPLARALGITLHSMELGRVGARYTPRAEHTTALGLLHAGIHAAVLETTMEGAVRSTLPAGDAALCVDLSLHLVRPVAAGDGPLAAQGKVIHAGRKRITAEARLTDATGRLVSHATAAFAVQSRRDTR